MLGAVLAAATLAACGGSDENGDRAKRDCGTKELYGRTLTLHFVGRPMSCGRARAIAAGSCDQRISRKRWACFSFRTPDPVLVWFLEKERFRATQSTAIEARRYPCSQAGFSRAEWRRAVASFGSDRFPTRLQVLADDLVRCPSLRGMSRAEFVRYLGIRAHGKRYVQFPVGDQRNSFMQTDPEYLQIKFDEHGRFRSASY
jgi:hypothetical protein